MSNTKFTKGPWVMCHRGESLQGYEGKDVVIWGCGLTNGSRTAERDANSALIATAPELYSMVELLTNELESAITEANLWRSRKINPATETPPDLIDGQTCHEAQLLLAKARGKL
jgi:hypothetical protein